MRMSRTSVLVLVAWFVAVVASSSATAQAPAPADWPDTYVARLQALALIQTLNAQILASRSATVSLEQWCRDHRLAAEPKIVARVAAGVDQPASLEQRRRLEIGDREVVKYRRGGAWCGT